MKKEEKKVVMQELSDEELEQAAGGQSVLKGGATETCLNVVQSSARPCPNFS